MADAEFVQRMVAALAGGFLVAMGIVVVHLTSRRR